MYIIVTMILAFLFVLFLVSQRPGEEIISEVEKIKAQVEPEVEHKSSLDPYISEDNLIFKEKRKYKQRKPKAKALVEVDNIIKKPKKNKAKLNII